MNSDLAAFICTRRDQVCGAALFKSFMVLLIRIIDVQKPSKARASMFTDDQIVTLGGTPITRPQFSAGREAPTKNCVICPVYMAFEIDFEPMLRFVGMHDPVRRILGHQAGAIVIRADANWGTDLARCVADQRSWRGCEQLLLWRLQFWSRAWRRRCGGAGR